MSTVKCSSEEDGTGGEYGALNQPDSNQPPYKELLDDSLLKMRKGLFGKSASYLQGEESGESSRNDGEGEMAAGEKMDESRAAIAGDDKMEANTSLVKTSIVTTVKIAERSPIADESATIVANRGTSVDDAEEKDLENTEKKENDVEQIQVATVVKTECIRVSKESVGNEDTVDDTQKAEDNTFVRAESSAHLDCKAGIKQDSLTLEKSKAVFSRTGDASLDDSKNSSDIGVCDEVELTAKSQESLNTNNEEKVGESMEQEIVETKKVEPEEEASRTPDRDVDHFSQSPGDSNRGETSHDEAKMNDVQTDRRRRSLRTRKTVTPAKHPVTKNNAAIGERRKSLRTPKKLSTPVSAVKTSRREKKTEKTALESEWKDDDASTIGKVDKKNFPNVSVGTKSVHRPPKKEMPKKKRELASESDKDPFNLDSNFDNHPEPLHNIQVERQSFGGCKFTKSPEKLSVSRYQKTEQTASERRSNLIGLLSQQEIVPRKSISELALSASRQSGTTPTSKKKMKASNGEFSDHLEPGGSSRTPKALDGDESEEKRKITSEHKQTPSTYDFQPIQKQRKRKIVEAVSVVTPKKLPETVLPVLSAEEQQQADRRPNEHAPYSVGARIYALWDRLYYSARISAEQDASGRYEVVFVEDGAVRKLVATGIIPLCNLVVNRQCLITNIKDDEEVLEVAEIVEAPSIDDAHEWMEGMFSVKDKDSGITSRISWQNLVLDSSQAKSLQAATVNTVRDVNADNIASAERRRSRAARHSAALSETFSPAFSQTKTGRRRTSTAENEMSKRSSTKTPTSKNEEAHFELEHQKETSVPFTKPKKVPVAKIFNGITFVVTSAVRKNKEADQGFSKKEIRYLIECGGGKVIDDVMKLPQGKPIYLIADTHYRTHKYLTALARSIPCVSNQWISDCAKENKLLDHAKYMLPAGISLLTGELKPWHSNNGTLLSGKRIHIFSSNVFYDMPNFVQIWTPLINHMGGTVLPMIPKDGLDILLTDASCTEDILNKVRSQGAIVVSSEWIIQAIIHGSLPEPNAHERFKYDYNDTCS